jgi:hypothetical protein
VVLQDSSAGPLKNRPSFERHARLLDTEIRTGGARTVFYMTCAHRSRPQTQADIADAYRSVAGDLNAILAPAGLAWQRVGVLDPAVKLYHSDSRHASAAGSYLSACVLHAAITGANPLGLPSRFEIQGKPCPSLEAKPAALLQQTAWETVQSHRAPADS